MENEKTIYPIEFVEPCAVCKNPKSKKELHMIEDDFSNGNEGKYICKDCLRDSKDYGKCEGVSLGVSCNNIYNINDKREDKYDNLCSYCSASKEESDSYSDEDLEQITDYYD